MSELDPVPTSRLRRRSFFEGMETVCTTGDTVALNENDFAPPTSGSSGPTDGESYAGVGTLSPKPGKVMPEKATGGKGSACEDHSVPFRPSKPPSRAYDMVKLVLDRHKLGWMLKNPKAWLRPWQRDPSMPVKYWEYPTQWLTYASLSLVLFQLIILWYFQTLSLDLQVHECVFKEKLLASSDLTQPTTLAHTSTVAALKFLERRFEQQNSPRKNRQPGQARLPWTCLAVIPTESDTSTAQATDLAFVWPRSQVVTPSGYSKIASRLYVAVGASPLERETDTSAEVFAVLAPLSALRPALFGVQFPDLIFVKTEFALRQLLKYRQEQHDERELQGISTGGTTLTANGVELDLAASHFGIYLLRTTVPDIYNRQIHKNWNEFLHIVVVGDEDKKKQYTEELLGAWVAHPTWPMLHIRFQQSLTLCGSFQRLLSTMIKTDEEAPGEGEAAKPKEEEEERATESWKRILNVDLVCDEEANSPPELVRLKNAIGMHLFPVPPELEKYEEIVLDTLAVGAITVTYNTPIMQEWVPDSSGLRVGTYEYVQAKPEAETNQEMMVKLPLVHVTVSAIEHAIEELLALDRVNRVAAGRAARVQYLRMRTHYLSAVAALDAAICEGDGDEEGGETTWSEIGQHKRRKVQVETMRAFLY